MTSAIIVSSELLWIIQCNPGHYINCRYPVSSSQPAGYPQQYPGQQYPPTYTQAGPPNPGPQAAQQGPPTGPRPPMSR